MQKTLMRPVIVLIALIVVAMCTISMVAALSRVDKPFPGFLIYSWPYAGSLSLKEWPGRQAGLEFLDRIVAVDGQPIRNGRDIQDIIKYKTPGALVNYVVEVDGKTNEITLPVSIFGKKDFVLIFLIAFLCGLILCTLGIIVVSLKPNISSSWVFLVLCLSLGGYMITSFDIMTSYYLSRIHLVLLVIYPFSIFHLALIFPDKKRIVVRFPALEYLIYLPAFVLIVAWQIYLFTFPQLLDSESALSSIFTYKLLGSITRMFILLSVIFFLVLVFHSLFKASSISARQRARMILFGITIGFLPPVIIMMAAQLLKVTFPWNFLVFFVIFFPASIAYSIVRHNLFDADTIIRRTVGYFVSTVIVIGIYALLTVTFNLFMGQYQVAQSRGFPILFTLGVILVFNPLRDRVQALVDRIFFRKEYDYGAIIDKISNAIASLMDLDQILRRLTRTFIGDIYINTSSVMLLNPDGTSYQVYLADGENYQDVEKTVINRDEPIIKIIEKEKKELTKNDVLEDPKFRDVSKSCAEKFDNLLASLIVPLVLQDKVIGMLNLGEKKSGKFYNRQDIDLLNTIANQGAVAIENARLFQENLEKQRMEEELSIARDLQMSMLPAACPEIKGFRIAASSTPAREVGGDFYDFIEMGEHKAGLVIADVTGKSVSGALVMSASRSVFRMLSEEELTVNESMMRANRRLKKDVKTGMFVALLFAVFNSLDRTLTLCSAGQTQPIHMSAATGKAALVETQGDTFPLGILDDSEYEETQLKLEPGDKVVLYTDGIVEAMNEQEEMFGFDRLIEVIQAAKAMAAEALLKEILDKVNEFAGGAAQHDDLTVIVVSVE